MNHFNEDIRQIFNKRPTSLFLTGGSYSGKSQFALSLLPESERAIIVGLGSGDDPDLQERIQLLKKIHSPSWRVIEPFDQLSSCLDKLIDLPVPTLIDSMNQWVGNMIITGSKIYTETQLEAHLQHEWETLLDTLSKAPPKPWIFISADVCSGPPPAHSLARVYRRQVGLMNQKIASISNTCVKLECGVPSVFKNA